MRTTVTLEPDVEIQLRRLMREQGLTFKDAVNMAVRSGLAKPAASAPAFRTRPRSLGLRPGIDLTHAVRIAADLEDEEVARKLEQRK